MSKGKPVRCAACRRPLGKPWGGPEPVSVVQRVVVKVPGKPPGPKTLTVVRPEAVDLCPTCADTL